MSLFEKIKSIWPKKKRQTSDKIPGMIACVCNLELSANQIHLLGQTPFNFGNVTLKGSTRPSVQYMVFDDKFMEFVQVTVYVTGKAEFQSDAYIISSDEATKGDLIETKTKPEHLKPFKHIVDSFSVYCPLPRRSRG